MGISPIVAGGCYTIKTVPDRRLRSSMLPGTFSTGHGWYSAIMASARKDLQLARPGGEAGFGPAPARRHPHEPNRAQSMCRRLGCESATAHAPIAPKIAENCSKKFPSAAVVASVRNYDAVRSGTLVADPRDLGFPFPLTEGKRIEPARCRPGDVLAVTRVHGAVAGAKKAIHISIPSEPASEMRANRRENHESRDVDPVHVRNGRRAVGIEEMRSVSLHRFPLSLAHLDAPHVVLYGVRQEVSVGLLACEGDPERDLAPCQLLPIALIERRPRLAGEFVDLLTGYAVIDQRDADDEGDDSGQNYRGIGHELPTALLFGSAGIKVSGCLALARGRLNLCYKGLWHARFHRDLAQSVI